MQRRLRRVRLSFQAEAARRPPLLNADESRTSPRAAPGGGLSDPGRRSAAGRSGRRAPERRRRDRTPERILTTRCAAAAAPPGRPTSPALAARITGRNVHDSSRRRWDSCDFQLAVTRYWPAGASRVRERFRRESLRSCSRRERSRPRPARPTPEWQARAGRGGDAAELRKFREERRGALRSEESLSAHVRSAATWPAGREGNRFNLPSAPRKTASHSLAKESDEHMLSIANSARNFALVRRPGIAAGAGEGGPRRKDRGITSRPSHAPAGLTVAALKHGAGTVAYGPTICKSPGEKQPGTARVCQASSTHSSFEPTRRSPAEIVAGKQMASSSDER